MIIYALMKANTMANSTGGSVYHALISDARGMTCAALCGSKPGRRGMWSSYLGKEITCPKCQRILETSGAYKVAIDEYFALETPLGEQIDGGGELP